MAKKSSKIKWGKSSKYSAEKTTIDGTTFDSKKEATYYTNLKLRVRMRDITNLRLQVPYELAPAQVVAAKAPYKILRDGTPKYKEVTVHKALHYIADFVYEDSKGITHVVDVKGFRTQEYIKKRNLMQRIYGITIEEI